jgi:hypothetical protein
MQTKKRLHQYWLDHVYKQERSSLNATEYCNKNNLRVKTFYKWRKKIEAEDKDIKGEEKSLVELPAKAFPILQTKQSYYDLIINNSIRIRVSKYFDSELLARILKIIKEV